MYKSVLILVLSTCCWVSASAQDKVTRDDSVEQLKVFDRYIGQWKYTMKSGDVTEMIGDMKTAWIHGGKLVRQSWTMEPIEGQPAASGESVMTFDVPKQIYRQWTFNSFGHSAEMTGKWDDEKQVMIWTGKDSYGNKSVTRSSFDDKDHEKFRMEVTDPAGTPLVSFEGATTRK